MITPSNNRLTQCRYARQTRFHATVTVALCFVLLAYLLTASALADDAALYKPNGQEAWDFWFARSNDTYYAFYLQAPEGLGSDKFGKSTVGLATSKDLVHWNEAGEVLRANPKGQWCDSHIATGSVWNAGNKWQMLFTACGKDGGIGLAESDDLKTWRMVGPVHFDYKPHVVPEHPYWQAQGLKAGETLRYEILADPYVLPEPVEGWSYMVANCAIVDRPVNKRGCIGLLRTKDGLAWEDCGIVALMLDYDRPETPQLWRHADRWYLYFGGAREQEAMCRHNRVYSAASMNGPFEPPPKSELILPDGRPFYIAKVITGPNGGDFLFGCVGGARLSPPYPVQYAVDGSISLGPPVTAGP